MDEILKLLGRDCTLSTEQLAAMLNLKSEEVKSAIGKFENEGVILGYKAVIDWEKASETVVNALIAVNVIPQRGGGFDLVAENICKYDEVESVYLMSGGYDLTVMLSGRTMREVALFVVEKLATMESVTGTATHFLLKKYKEGGVMFHPQENNQERILMV